MNRRTVGIDERPLSRSAVSDPAHLRPSRGYTYLVNQLLTNEFSTEGLKPYSPALVVLECFKSQLSYLFIYYNLDILVIIYSLSIYFLNYIYYNPMFIIQREEI